MWYFKPILSYRSIWQKNVWKVNSYRIHFTLTQWTLLLSVFDNILCCVFSVEFEDAGSNHCPLCGTSYYDAVNLTTHMWENHADLMGPKKRGRPKKILTTVSSFCECVLLYVCFQDLSSECPILKMFNGFRNLKHKFLGLHILNI